MIEWTSLFIFTVGEIFTFRDSFSRGLLVWNLLFLVLRDVLTFRIFLNLFRFEILFNFWFWILGFRLELMFLPDNLVLWSYLSHFLQVNLTSMFMALLDNKLFFEFFLLLSFFVLFIFSSGLGLI